MPAECFAPSLPRSRLNGACGLSDARAGSRAASQVALYAFETRRQRGEVMSMSMDWLTERRGSPVYDAAGEKIGKIEEIYYDDDSNRPEWVGIGTGFFGTKRVLVPIDGANSFEDGLQIPFSKEYVKDSPDVDEDEIHGARETELYT